MIVYLGALTFLCLLALWSVFLPNWLHVARHGISALGYGSMCVFIGLRDQVGADWVSYKEIFSVINGLPVAASLFVAEPLYAALNRIVYAAGGDIFVVNLICASILLACLFNFSRLLEIDSNLLLFVAAPYVLFVVGMGYTRQSVALGLSLNAIGYCRHGRMKLFYLYAGTATLFHYSAIFLILVGWTNTRKRLRILIVATTIASPVLFGVMSGDRYMRYFNNDVEMQSHGVWTRILMLLMALIVMYSQKRQWAKENLLLPMVIRGAVALGLLAVLSMFLSTLADRICLYLFFLYLLGIGNLIHFAPPPLKYISIMLVVSVTFAIFLGWFSLSAFAAAGWFPYGNALFRII